MSAPDWWTELHDAALASLTPEWQRLHSVALDDLVACGMAERRFIPIVSPHGRPAGETIEFRSTP